MHLEKRKLNLKAQFNKLYRFYLIIIQVSNYLLKLNLFLHQELLLYNFHKIYKLLAISQTMIMIIYKLHIYLLIVIPILQLINGLQLNKLI